MRPYLEKLPVLGDASWSLLNRRLDDAIPFQWHHHPEFELTLTLNSLGQRFIGDHVGSYGDGDLVLVGPNLPHTWASRAKLDPAQPHIALVMWFHPAWAARLSANLIEFAAIEALLARASNGLHFSASAANAVRQQIETLITLSAPERLLALLAILEALSRDTGAEPLASVLAIRQEAGESRERVDRVLTHIHQHYTAPVPLCDLADIAALSPSGLHRLFFRHTGTNISHYLTQLRIGDACARLTGTGQPIAHIADAVGYGSFANFNRHFRALKAMTPRQYRARFHGSIR